MYFFFFYFFFSRRLNTAYFFDEYRAPGLEWAQLETIALELGALKSYLHSALHRRVLCGIHN